MDFLRTASQYLFSQENNQDVDAQPKLDETKIVGFIKNRLEECRQNNARLAFESNVVTNTAYLLGYNSIYYDSRMRMFRGNGMGSAGPARARPSTNLILPSVQNRTARLCKNPPRFDVRPESPNEEDKEAARLSLKVLMNVFDREQYDEKRIENAMWMQQAGSSWIKTGWDPNKGKKIEHKNPLTGEVLDSEREGDIYLEVISPLEIFVDPLAKNMESAAWLIHAKVRPLSYFRDQYKRGGEVKAEDTWLQSLQYLDKIRNMTNKTGGENQEQIKNAAIEMAYYEKPTKKFPNGRLIIAASNILLAYKPLPIDEIPFTKFDDVKVGGKFYSESLITHIRPIQDQYDRIQRRKAEFVNKCLTAKYMAPKGHGIIEEGLNDTTEIMEYNPVEGASEPKQMTPPQMPQYVFQEDQTLKSNISEIEGIGEASKGQAPNSQMPAIGMQLLVEQDDTRIGVVVTSNENSHASVGRHVLKFANVGYTNKRMLKETGAAGEYTFTEVSAEMLRNHTDVFVIRGSTLPGSKTLKRQDITNLYQLGVLGDPNDPLVKSKVVESMEFGFLDDVWADISVDRQQVDRTIKMIEQGIPPIVDPDDNHQMHYEQKNRLRKSEKFISYPLEIQELLKANIAEHKMYLQPPVDPMTGMPLNPNMTPPPPEGPVNEEPVNLGNETTEIPPGLPEGVI